MVRPSTVTVACVVLVAVAKYPFNPFGASAVTPQWFTDCPSGAGEAALVAIVEAQPCNSNRTDAAIGRCVANLLRGHSDVVSLTNEGGNVVMQFFQGRRAHVNHVTRGVIVVLNITL